MSNYSVTGRADGSVIINTQLNTDGFSQGANNLKQQFSGMGAALKKFGGIVAAVFSVKEILAFGKEAIGLGSDLQEVQNVVGVTFTTMSDQVDEFAKNAIFTAGLSETMAKRYVGTFGAMAKSFQFTEAEAYDMATALTQLTGDVASFYNITQDAAYTKLKSVFTGETESLKELGVVMTQTALDDFAMRKGFGKTVNQMSEQEKVALRYQFVLERLALASGDFIRTQDGWANQMRILNVQIENLKSNIGQGLINMLTPAIQAINLLLAKVQQLAQAFKYITSVLFGDAGGSDTGIAETMGDAAENAENLEAGITGAGKAAQKALMGFDEITKLTDQAAGGAESVGSSFVPMADPTGDSGSGDDGITEKLRQKLQPIIDFIQKAIAKIKLLFKPLAEINFTAAIEEFKRLAGVVITFTKEALKDLEWVWYNILVPLAKWAIESVTPESIALVTSVLQSMITAVRAARDGIKDLWTALQPAIEWIKSIATWVIQNLKTRFDELTAVIQANGPEISNILSNIGIILGVVWEKVKPILDKLKTAFDKVFTFIGKISSGTLNDIIQAFSGLVQFIAGVLTGDWTKAWNGIEKIFDAMLDGITRSWNTAWEEIAQVLNAMIAKIVQGMNGLIGALNKIKFDFPDWVPGLGGKSFGLNLEPLKTPQISIPYLAKGAVIPPNAPFMAMLGDQRHGTNIEAPLSTIQEAVANVMGDQVAAMMTGFNALLEENRMLRQVVENIEIGDSTIGAAVGRYYNKMAIVRGG